MTKVYCKYDDVIFCVSHALLVSKNTNPAVLVVLITIFLRLKRLFIGSKGR